MFMCIGKHGAGPGRFVSMAHLPVAFKTSRGFYVHGDYPLTLLLHLLRMLKLIMDGHNEEQKGVIARNIELHYGHIKTRKTCICPVLMLTSFSIHKHQ